LGTDRWTRRGGDPSSAQAFKVGSATRLHQHSSQKRRWPTRDRPRRLPSVDRAAFFLSYRGSGEVIHRFARIHLTERRRDSDARMVSPETRSSVSPSSKATSAAICKVQRLDSRPNSLGERWSISLKDSAVHWSKASRVLLGREELAFEGEQAPLVEVVDGVAHRLRGASEVFGDLRGALAPGACQKQLRSAHGKSVFGAQPLFEAFALVFRQRTYKDWGFHDAYCNPSTKTYPEDALVRPALKRRST
jgi:hypothetical protein